MYFKIKIKYVTANLYSLQTPRAGDGSMRGWEFTGTNIPLKIVEKPDPVATPGRVIIDVKAAGL